MRSSVLSLLVCAATNHHAEIYLELCAFAYRDLLDFGPIYTEVLDEKSVGDCRDEMSAKPGRETGEETLHEGRQNL